jgi:glycosyltransferase involved in cell wall biosynthesis
MPPYPGAVSLRGASILTSLAHALAGNNVAVEAFTTTTAPQLLPDVCVRQISGQEMESGKGLFVRIISEFWTGFCGAREMFQNRGGCDLAIISSPSYLAALIMASSARRRGIPYVIDVRDIYPEVYVDAGLLRRNSILHRFFASHSRKFYNNARLVIAATDGLARTVIEQAPNANVTTIFNGFPAAFLGRGAEKHENFTVCFHGIMGFFQDIETLIEVARRLTHHGVDMVVIGYGRKEILMVNCELPNLRFLGRKSFEETINEIEKCHLGLCLRTDDSVSRDAFPVKIWEYLGLGIPSLVTPICEAGDFVEAHACGKQFSTGNVDALVREILTLKMDQARLRAMELNCKKIAEKHTREKMGLAAADAITKIF